MVALNVLAEALVDIAARAGGVIMRHYAGEIDARKKADESPVTLADEEAERLILRDLKELAPEIPIVSEEAAAGGHIPAIGELFFLVDPLDGTKEFINKNGEFTVNIALIAKGEPTLGVVYAPALDRLFVAKDLDAAFEIACTVSPEPGATPRLGVQRPIRARRPEPDGLVAVASRSHRDQKTEEYLHHYKVKAFRSAGSSLKFCLVAAGEADIYPRHGRTMEWDTAAGHAVVKAAGGTVTTLDGRPLTYGKVADGFANPYFVARGRL